MKHINFSEKNISTTNRAIFKKCITQVECDFLVDNANKVNKILRSNPVFTSGLIIILIDDGLDMSLRESSLINIAKKYNNKEFIIFQEYINDDSLNDIANLHNIEISNLVAEKEQYVNMIDIDKNMDSTLIGISLNGNRWLHRLISVSLLYALGLDKNCIITNRQLIRDCSKYQSIMHRINWDFAGFEHLSKMLDHGFKQMCRAGAFSIPTIYIPGNYQNSNNFDKCLRKYYENSFVEIVNETEAINKTDFLSTRLTRMLTEKTINSIHARNFPIFIGGAGIVKYLREFLGLDMFDDIIDHSYDEYVDPRIRFYKAINDNKELFTNPERTKQLWKDNEHRFNENVRIVKEDMYDLYYNHAITEFNKIIAL